MTEDQKNARFEELRKIEVSQRGITLTSEVITVTKLTKNGGKKF